MNIGLVGNPGGDLDGDLWLVLVVMGGGVVGEALGGEGGQDVITSGVDLVCQGGLLTGVVGGDTDLVDAGEGEAVLTDFVGELVTLGAPDEEQWPLVPPPRNILSRF